jgi:hypothetical protein
MSDPNEYPPNLNTPKLRAAWRTVHAWYADPDTGCVRRDLAINPLVECLVAYVEPRGTTICVAGVERIAAKLDQLVPGPGTELRSRAAEGLLGLVFQVSPEGDLKTFFTRPEPTLVHAASQEMAT